MLEFIGDYCESNQSNNERMMEKIFLGTLHFLCVAGLGNMMTPSIFNEMNFKWVRIVRNFPCQTLKISKVSLVVMGS
jgi:hypothetical protein